MRFSPAGDPGVPDDRSATRYLIWLAGRRKLMFGAGILLGVVWMVAQALMPAAVGRAVDGLSRRDDGALLTWALVLLGLGVLQAVAGVLRHQCAVRNWLAAAYRTVQLTVTAANRLGAALPRRVATGEVVSIGTSDINQIGHAVDITARGTGALVAIVTVAVILLDASVPLGLVVVLGVPVLMAVVGLLIRPLHRQQHAYRDAEGKLTTRAGDIVSGLRVLRGVGGEPVLSARYQAESQALRAHGVRVARVESLLEAAQVLLPGAFLVLVTWLAARFALDGRISPGQLVAFYGYTAFLVSPLRQLTEAVDKLTRGHVAARRVVRLLRLTPELVEPARPATVPDGPGELVDVESGVRLPPGRFTAIAAAVPEDAVAIVDRLGRYVDSDATLHGVPLRELPLATVRERILVADNEAQLFTGPLLAELDPHDRGDRSALDAALRTASATDIVKALPDGLDSRVAERGREFSGGQQQRLRLARALVAAPETLLLVEPTSAVDAHTEARIAAGLGAARAGRTTLVCTTSPLLLGHADNVIFVEDGKVVAEGSHAHLYDSEPRYRATVSRGELMSAALPVADATQVRRYARTLVRRHPRALATALGLHAVAAAAGLVAPRLLGDLVEGISRGTSRVTVDRIALLIAGFVVVQAVLVRFAHLASARLGEQVLARLREEFVDRVLALPLSTVERAGTGDLLTRTSRDVSALSRTVRLAVPETLIAVVTAAFIIGALLLVSPLLAMPCLIAVPVLWAGTRWYLRRAPAGYLRENAAYSDITDGISETVEGSRTTEALRQQARRRARTNADIARSYAAERYTLFLRTVFFPVAEIGYVVPVVATLVIGGWFYLKGWVTLGQVTAATLYVQQLVDPVDRLLSWLDELQVGGASMARLLGVAEPAAGHASGTAAPPGAAARSGAAAAGVAGPQENVDGDRRLVARNVRYAYRTGRDVLHGVTLVPEPGEKLAVVGPSGAGKSTLGRLLAGVHIPHGGTVTVAGRPLDTLPLTELRSHVALVTQEHHVFIGTLRENVAMVRPAATDADVRAALSAVAALDWAQALPDGLDTLVGSGGHPLSPAQAQQLALARLVLADPHTLVLDEATSLIDPRAARELERSLAAVLAGRTVIAIAHRLFSAHDADRVAVVEDGRITELGSHDELVAADGSYAALWHSWHGTP